MSEEKKASKGASKEASKGASKKFESIISEIEKMSVLDLSELVTILEEKFNVQAMAAVTAPTAVGTTTSAVGTESKSEASTEEKKEFTIILKTVGDKKIQVIKVVRTITGLGLKESKDLVDSVEASATPQKVKEKIKKEEAEEAKKMLEEAGATVELN